MRIHDLAFMVLDPCKQDDESNRVKEHVTLVLPRSPPNPEHDRTDAIKTKATSPHEALAPSGRETWDLSQPST